MKSVLLHVNNVGLCDSEISLTDYQPYRQFCNKSSGLFFSGGLLDLLLRRFLCAGTEKLARQLVGIIEQIEFERDWKLSDWGSGVDDRWYK